MTGDDRLRINEVAAYLQLEVSTIYIWAQTGIIPATKVGRSWIFSRQELENWLTANTTQPDAKENHCSQD
ncbi:MAG: helix-turn-helix domain-containing protein [Chloroflexi bacterium]|nr:helix-turn-helix domain-containing protein [Chloroflexota bacterium]